jgi:hypothetical protein
LKFCVQGLKDKKKELLEKKEESERMQKILRERLIIENKTEYEMMDFELNSHFLQKKREEQ